MRLCGQPSITGAQESSLNLTMCAVSVQGAGQTQACCCAGDIIAKCDQRPHHQSKRVLVAAQAMLHWCQQERLASAWYRDTPYS
eukprot:2656336-Amphidinium_carterae.1